MAFFAKFSATICDNSVLFFLFKDFTTLSFDDDDKIVIFFLSSIIWTLIFFEDLDTLNLNLPSYENFFKLFLTLNFFLSLVVNFIIFSFLLFLKYIHPFL